jgi:hypothetical protein
MLNNTNIIFIFTVLYYSSDLPFKYELTEEIQLNKLNLKGISNTLIIVAKLNM